MIYKFSKNGAAGTSEMKDLLGGKGANLAEMANLGLPVPPGFTIPTKICNDFVKDGDIVMSAIWAEVMGGMSWLESKFGFSPLVSVRSGAAVSMPGMMDTILNVGLTKNNLEEWADRIGTRTAFDSYRRLIQMLGCTAYGLDHAKFEAILAAAKQKQGVRDDKELSVESLNDVVKSYKSYWQAALQDQFPDDAEKQLYSAVRAVFNSWNNERAEKYRTMNGIPSSIGTAATVQAMVFGNMNDASGSGVAFSRNPSSGEPGMVGEFLPNAQGEDVVAGIRTPLNLTEMKTIWPDLYSELVTIGENLEIHYRDMQDVEFTVQNGVLYMLQCRTGKRGAEAAFRIGVDLYDDNQIDRKELFSRLKPEQYLMMQRSRISDDFKDEPLVIGLPACNGIATGKVVFSSKEAEASKEPVILVTDETTPDDIGGMYAAVGILTRTGGSTSHAAVVARAMDKPCIVGCESLKLGTSSVMIGTETILAGQKISIDGATGRVWSGEIPVVAGGGDKYVERVISMILEDTDCLLLSNKIEFGKTLLVTADLGVSRDVEAAKAVVEAIKNLSEDDRKKVFVEFRELEFYGESSDLVLWNAFGDANGMDKLVPQLILTAIKDDPALFSGVTVLGDPDLTVSAREIMRKKGIRFVTKAKTISDVMDGGIVMVDDKFIKTVVGTNTAWKKLSKLLGVGGELPARKTKMEVVFETLGGAC